MDAALQLDVEARERLAEQQLREIEAVQREVDHCAAARARRVRAPVVWRPVRPDPAGINDPHRDGPADLARFDCRGHRAVGGMMALVECGAGEQAPRGRRDRLGVGEAGGERLFAQHRHAGGGGGTDGGEVRVVGGGDIQRVERFGGEHRLDALVRRPAERRAGGGRRVRDRRDAAARRDDPRHHVIARHPAMADDAPADRLRVGVRVGFPPRRRPGPRCGEPRVVPRL